MSLAILIHNLPLILADFPGITLVYLFGSQVTGQVSPLSDYDLAVVDDSGEEALVLQSRFQLAVAKLLNTDRVDVVLADRVPIELAYHIIAAGKLLYQKDLAARVEFEAQVLGKYGDYLPILRYFQQHTLHGGTYGNRVQRYREALGRTQRTLGPSRTTPRTRTR